ncbi:MAG: lytic transglycosylase domain-containing protein [Bacteroidales bacterium]|jgi:hypothetical protein|nr:lytic transglycosylase domain-containing protein [Bacteroidales bacterium]
MNKKETFVRKAYFFKGIFIGTILILLLSAKDTSYQKQNEMLQLSDNYRITDIHLPDKLDFAGEAVPVERYDVREFLERELLINSYWQSSILQYCKRANRYFPVIEPILKSNNIPDDFKYLALAESGFLNVTSPANAAGFWQFLASTAKKHDLEVRDDVDERYHLQKATVAACKYLKNSYQVHHSWALAAAAYNAGDTYIKKRCADQSQSTFWDLWLNTETARYVYRILALKLLLSEPQKYGIYLKKSDLYYPIVVDLISVDSTIASLYDFAKQQKTTYKQLKLLNPWLISDKLENPQKKTYQIAIPRKEYLNYKKQMENIGKDDYVKTLNER